MDGLGSEPDHREFQYDQYQIEESVPVFLQSVGISAGIKRHLLTREKMKRRDFLAHTIPAAALLPELINGLPVRAMNRLSPMIQALMAGTTQTDHVLVLIQLSGGNDGLNMVIPLDRIRIMRMQEAISRSLRTGC